MGFSLEGWDELSRALGRIGELLEEVGGSASAKQALKKSGDKIVKAARERLNPGSKNIRPAIKTRIKIDPVKESLGEVGINYSKEKMARHSHLVENGHMNFNQYGGPFGRTPPHPFWGPALNAKRKDMLNTMQKITVDALKKIWRE